MKKPLFVRFSFKVNQKSAFKQFEKMSSFLKVNVMLDKRDLAQNRVVAGKHIMVLI